MPAPLARYSSHSSNSIIVNRFLGTISSVNIPAISIGMFSVLLFQGSKDVGYKVSIEGARDLGPALQHAGFLCSLQQETSEI